MPDITMVSEKGQIVIPAYMRDKLGLDVIVSILIRKAKPRDLYNSVLEEKMKIILSEELFGDLTLR